MNGSTGVEYNSIPFPPLPPHPSRRKLGTGKPRGKAAWFQRSTVFAPVHLSSFPLELWADGSRPGAPRLESANLPIAKSSQMSRDGLGVGPTPSEPGLIGIFVYGPGMRVLGAFWHPGNPAGSLGKRKRSVALIGSRESRHFAGYVPHGESHG